jgi:hypothetical protein
MELEGHLLIERNQVNQPYSTSQVAQEQSHRVKRYLPVALGSTQAMGYPAEVRSGRSPFTSAFWTDGWVSEVLKIIVSTVAFTTLIIILAIYNGKTTPQVPFGVTFNAIISTLATLVESTAVLVVAAALSQYRWLWLRATKHGCKLRDIQLLDDASRGPWGSLALLPHLAGRWLVALGAVTMVLSVALQAFVQQAPLFSVKALHTYSGSTKVFRATTAEFLGIFVLHNK